MAINLLKLTATYIDQFTGRAWLLPKLLEWWDDSDERLFLLTGGPGTGKSMILAWLARFGPEPADAFARVQLARLREVVKAVHFFQASSRNITPKAFAESIANQLTETVSGFGDALAATLAERVSIVGTAHADTATGSSLTGVAIGQIGLGALGDTLSFDRAFTEPLKKLYESGHSEPMLLLVDALDEALGYTGDKTVPELLSTLSDLPPQVRILMTTRDDPRVLAFYEDEDEVKLFDIIKNAQPNVDDVQDYVVHRLGDSTGLTQAQSIEFSHRVAIQAKGIFLYAAIVLDELLPQLPQIPNLDNYPLPVGLSGLYRAFLKRELGTEDKGRRWHQTYKLLLGLIAVAQGEGLTAAQLSALTGQDVAEPLDACKQYLIGELPDGPFRPFHKSFVDFLLEDKENVRHHIDAQSMHRRIGDHYWAQYHGDWSKCDNYGLDNLAFHLRSAGYEYVHKLHALVKNRSWYQARRNSTGRVSPFLEDVSHAWAAIELPNEQHVRQNESSGHLLIGGEIDCALIASTHKSGLPQPALLAALLKHELVSGDEALDYALQLPSEKVKADALVKLMPFLSCKFTNKLLQASSGLRQENWRVEALSALARRLSKKDLGGLLESTPRIASEFLRGKMLEGIAPFLASDQLDLAYRVAGELQPNRARERAISSLSRRWAELGEINQAKMNVDLITNPYCWILAISGLLPFFRNEIPLDLLLKALNKAQTIEDPIHQRDAFLSLRPYIRCLDESEQSDWNARSQEAIRISKENNIRAPIVSVLRFVDNLPDEEKVPVLEMAMNALNELSDRYYLDNNDLRIQLAVKFSQSGATEKALAMAMRDQLLKPYLLPYLIPPQQSAVLAECRDWASSLDKEPRLEALALLADFLSPEECKVTLRLALAEASTIGDRDQLLAMISCLPPLIAELGYVEDALTLCEQIGSPMLRARTLINIADRCSEERQPAALMRALQAIEEVQDDKCPPDLDGYSDYWRDGLLCDLVPRLAKVGCKDEAFSIIQRLPLGTEGWGAAFAKATKWLTPADPEKTLEILEHRRYRVYYYDDLLTEVISELPLSVLRRKLCSIRNHRYKLFAATIIRLAELGEVDAALERIAEITDFYWKAKVCLGCLAHAKQEDQRSQLLGVARVAGLKVESANDRAEVLALVAKHLRGSDQDEIRTVASKAARKAVFRSPRSLPAVLALELPSNEFWPMLALSRTLKQPALDQDTLDKIIPCLSKTELDAAYRGMLKDIQNDYDHDELCCKIIVRLAKLGYGDEALEKLRQLTRMEFMAQALEIIPIYLDSSQLRTALKMAFQIDQRWRATGIAGIVRQLSENDLLEQVVDASCALLDVENRRVALAALAERIRSLSPRDAYALWRRALRILAHRNRMNLVSDLAALSPVISMLGGKGSLKDVWESVVSMESWQP